MQGMNIWNRLLQFIALIELKNPFFVHFCMEVLSKILHSNDSCFCCI